MFTLVVKALDAYDEEAQRFTTQGGVEFQLEHSLVSLSKWESIYEKSFLDQKQRPIEETQAYIECMLLTENPPEDFLGMLSVENYEQVNEYISRKMTATWFSELAPKPNREIITAELIYYWMTVFNIPFECETWHLNRLFTLIRICNLKQDKPKKMSRSEAARRNRALNEQRKAQLGTKG